MAAVIRPTRLPVWPVLNGLFTTLLDLVGLRAAATWIEARVGGRVAPMMFNAAESDPFILLVHHRHRFDGWDPIRPLFRLLLPEGFPAHPHRGFETVTITLQGGLTHRDSFGVKQTYGDGDVQWLTAGRGMLHEEMWAPDADGRAELYQLWVNLPRTAKFAPPKVQVLGTGPVATAPVPRVTLGELAVDVIAGEVAGAHSPATTHSAMTILRVYIPAGGTGVVPVPSTHTCLVYVREGEIVLGPSGAETPVPALHLASLTPGGFGVAVRATGGAAAEILLLAGEPLREPVVASGTWVMNTQQELQDADRDYAAGRMGVPWDHRLTDTEWKEWLASHRLRQ